MSNFCYGPQEADQHQLNDKRASVHNLNPESNPAQHPMTSYNDYNRALAVGKPRTKKTSVRCPLPKVAQILLIVNARWLELNTQF